MTCHAFQQALIDESVPRGPALEAHLATCEACQAFAHAERSAQGLVGQALLPGRRVDVPAVRRRLAVVGAAALAVFGAAGLMRGPGRAAPVEATVPAVASLEAGETALPVEQASEEADAEAWAAMVALHGQVQAALAGDPMRTDRSYASFGALPTWLAPTGAEDLLSRQAGARASE